MTFWKHGRTIRPISRRNVVPRGLSVPIISTGIVRPRLRSSKRQTVRAVNFCAGTHLVMHIHERSNEKGRDLGYISIMPSSRFENDEGPNTNGGIYSLLDQGPPFSFFEASSEWIKNSQGFSEATLFFFPLYECWSIFLKIFEWYFGG